MGEPALSDVVAVEFGGSVACAYAAKLLADLGAVTVRVEPDGGDPLRRAAPLLVNGESAFFHYLNANKLSVEAGVTDPRLGRLLRRADVVFHAVTGAEADRLEDAILEGNPRAVVVSLTPYGRSGPRSGWKSSELTEYATGGYHYYGGDPAREPLALPGHQTAFHAATHGAIGALAGLWHARETGRGQRVEVSHQEAMLSAQAWLTTMWTHAGQVQRRTGSAMVPCKDGHVFLFHLVPYPNLFVLMERFDVLEDRDLFQPRTWWARFPEVLGMLAEWAADKTKQEIYHAAQALRVAISPVNTMADLAESAQLAAREWFLEQRVGDETVRVPGFPYRLSGTPPALRRPAPAPGEHTEAVLSGSLLPERPAGATAGPGTAQGRLPLEGIRVLEMTANWAGPLAARHLADLGADVIKIELQTKPATRALVPLADDLWPRHYNRSGYFNKMNRNKRDVCLNIATPEGRETFLALVRTADVLVENNAARVMKNLGADYEVLREVNPRLIMCSVSGFGATGPECNYSAYGSNIETISGLSSLLGYGPGDCYGTGSFYADPVAGNHAAVAVLAALHARRSSGRGQWIDLALLESVIPFFGWQFLSYVVTGTCPEPMGNRHPEFAPQGVYPSYGNDCWLALTVRDADEWRALCRVIGREDLAEDPRLASADGRRAHHDEIDEAIRVWSATLDHNEAARLLQAAGVPAAPVMANWEVASDNHLHERGFFVAISHPEAGTHLWPGFPWRFERTPLRVRRPSPLFAEHNAEVFQGDLGLSDEEVRALYAANATADAPVYGEQA